MNEAIKKLTDEVKAHVVASLATKEWQDFFAKVKAAGDSGSFEVIISTADIDRSGESIVQNGIDLANYKTNPIVLWAHDYYALPIGVADSVEMVEGKLVAKGRFAPEEANPFAQQVRRLYDAGIVRATSVGFIVKEMNGNVITKSELLEFSFVPVPANPYALSMRQAKELGLDLGMLVAKGIKVQPEQKAEGDTCTLDDGTEGVMDANGTCVPKPAEAAAKAEGDVCTLEDGSEGVIDAAGDCVPKTGEASAKGAVADEINADAQWEQKWANLDQVCDILDAFFNVYLDEATPVENFTTLLTETVNLLSGLTGGTAAAAEVLQKAIAERGAADPKSLKRFVLRSKAVKTVEAIGAEVAAMQAEVDTSMSAHAMRIIEICREAGMPETTGGEAAQHESTTKENGAVGEIPEGSVGEETPSGASPKQVDPLGGGATREFDDFHVVRQLLRAAATATGQALERMNTRASDARKTR